jgi:predicted nucleic acid-binding protein
MANYLADTSLIIDLINNRNERRQFIQRLLKPGDTLSCCTINVIEVCTGMHPGEEAITANWFDRLPCHGVTREIAERAGALRYHWRKLGKTLSLADATIAAVAIHHRPEKRHVNFSVPLLLAAATVGIIRSIKPHCAD